MVIKIVVKKILNNNSVISEDINCKEVIVMGKGIGFSKKNGDLIDETKIQKIFVLEDDKKNNQLINLLEDIPEEYFELSQMIIQRASQKLGKDLADSIYLSLTDHLYMSIARYREGLHLKNKLLFEIENFYPDEFRLGLEALNIIESLFSVKMAEDEAAFIAMHIVVSENGDDMEDFYKSTKLVQSILNIVKFFFKVNFNVESFYYQRFLRHLRFFSLRILSGEDQKKLSLKNDLLPLIKDRYVDAYQCTLKIKDFVNNSFNYILDDEEILYLTIHISQVISDIEEEKGKNKF
ncbi:MAG: PRD domain-containing protein [Anaerococcus sp.]|uniref:BglG family transcription antiterminator LicT n=1 Tax=Anaerococcus sp. TaxID=1872515 RepID=UPI0026051525|nr:PRD domain-containing protein [Anaerococcus sp.]MCI5972702.1 PRD domain-containing protein [Anaerococcus sp.]